MFLALSDITLLGQHNYRNILSVLACCHLLKIPMESCRAAIVSFQPLSHRLQLFGTFRGITFYDDAISTTPESTMEAIKVLKDSLDTIFLGGEDRGYDFTALAKMIDNSHIQNIVLFPHSGQKIQSFLRKKHYRFLLTSSMQQAVQFAYQNTQIGKVCLLSCASPSYSIWKNFQEKGDEFQKYVRNVSHSLV